MAFSLGSVIFNFGLYFTVSKFVAFYLAPPRVESKVGFLGDKLLLDISVKLTPLADHLNQLRVVLAVFNVDLKDIHVVAHYHIKHVLYAIVSQVGAILQRQMSHFLIVLQDFCKLE